MTGRGSRWVPVADGKCIKSSKGVDYRVKIADVLNNRAQPNPVNVDRVGGGVVQLEACCTPRSQMMCYIVQIRGGAHTGADGWLTQTCSYGAIQCGAAACSSPALDLFG